MLGALPPQYARIWQVQQNDQHLRLVSQYRGRLLELELTSPLGQQLVCFSRVTVQIDEDLVEQFTALGWDVWLEWDFIEYGGSVMLRGLTRDGRKEIRREMWCATEGETGADLQEYVQAEMERVQRAQN